MSVQERNQQARANLLYLLFQGKEEKPIPVENTK